MEKVYYPYLKWYPPTPYYSLFFLFDQNKILAKPSYKVANLKTSHIVPKTQGNTSGHGEKKSPDLFFGIWIGESHHKDLALEAGKDRIEVMLILVGIPTENLVPLVVRHVIKL